MGLATHCTIASESVFARKNYFYPDCPKNYQISQYESPLGTGGYVTIGADDKKIGITRIHLEEDAGKLVHAAGEAYSYVDMNRCGVPLIEIVSEPDIRTPAEAREYVRKLRTLLRYLEICDGNMEEGSLRCDVNVSVRESGSGSLGVKTEIKNVNSFKFVEQSLVFEIERQSRILDGGGEITYDTLQWDPGRGEARIMRTKERDHDYRYFPEPDLLVLRTTESMVAAAAEALPELPDSRKGRFIGQYGLSPQDASALTATREVADYFERVVARSTASKTASNWIKGEVMRELNEQSIEITAFRVRPEDLAELIYATESGKINSPTAKVVFREMVASGAGANEIIAARDLEQITDDDVIRQAAQKVVDGNSEAVEKYLRGKDTLLKYFVGQLMIATGRKANPRQAEAILKELLENRRHEP
jgi:aspartyl-tRNA(Asn)/glutamyl-tRNA(Gln) amidotransferase subunit B